MSKRNIKHKYGWHRQKKDQRDFVLARPRIARADLPDKVDLRDQMPPVFNQETLGSCSAQAWSAAFKYAMEKDCGTTPFTPSRLFIYYGERVLMDTCLSGNVKIALLNGEDISIKELFEKQQKNFWLYGCDENGRIVPTMAKEVINKGKRHVVIIELDNGEKIACTPEHKILMRDNSYIAAEHLRAGDSIMPLYRRYEKGYEKVYIPNIGKYVWTHRLVPKSINPEMIKLLNKKEITHVVHHKDFNKRNNNPENLEVMTIADHAILHIDKLSAYTRTSEAKKISSDRLKKLWENEDYRKMMIKLSKENGKKLAKKILDGEIIINHRTQKTIEWCSSLAKKLWEDADFREMKCSEASKTTKRRWEDAEERKKLCLGIKEAFSDPSIRENMSKKSKEMWENPEYRKRMIPIFTKAAQERGKTKEFKDLVSKRLSSQWEDKEYRDAEIEMLKASWKNNETREKRISGMKKAWEDPVKRKTRIANIKAGREKSRLNKKLNHKIISVSSGEEEDVFDIVETHTHNFALSSGLFVHNCNEDSGAFLRDGAKTLAKEGACDETEWEYDIKKFTVKPPDSCYEHALTHQALTYWAVPQDLKSIQACLAEGFPVVLGIMVFESIESDEVAKTGILNMPKKGEKRIGGHAVCVPPNTYITTDIGPRKIENIKVGDSVLTHLGRFRKVMSISKRNINEEIMVIHNQCGNDLRITKEHPIYSKQYSPQTKLTQTSFHGKMLDDVKWIESKNLNSGCLLYRPIACGENMSKDIYSENEFFELLGMYLGDGNITRSFSKNGNIKSLKLRFSLGTDYPELIDRCKYLLSKYSKNKVGEYYPKGEKYVILTCYDTELAKLVGSLCGYAKNKSIDKRLLFSNINLQKSLITGWINTDGCIIGKSIMIATSEENLMWDLCFILQRVRVLFSITKREERDFVIKGKASHGKPAYHILLSNCNEEFIQNRTNHRTIYEKGYLVSKVTKIKTENYSGNVFNIHVEEDNSYVANGIAVHNCAVGYDNSIARFIIRNSWGKEWGQNGYFEIPYEYITMPRLAADLWTLRTVEMEPTITTTTTVNEYEDL